MKILSVNFRSREGDVAGNVKRAAEWIRREYQTQRADLAMLPELFTCGYCALDLSPWSESTDSDSFRSFRALSDELDTIIGWGFAERAVPGKVYNAYAVVEPGKPPAIVRKTHLHRAQKGLRTDEPEFLLPGDRLGIVDTRLGRLGVMICYDGCFAEVPRCLTLQGALCILWPTRSGGYLASTALPQVRALDNLIPVVMCEGSQTGGDLPLVNHARVVDHLGNPIAECRNEERALLVNVDTETARQLREKGQVNLGGQYRVRRPELYSSIISKTHS